MPRKMISCVVIAVLLIGTLSSMADVPITVSSKFDVTIYGYVKLDASYDTQKTQGDLAFFVLPEVDGEKDNEFNMTARQSRLGLKIGGPELGNGKVSAKVETDFYGQGAANNKADLRMRLAYVEWKDDTFQVSAGQRWETFITVLPKTVDFSTYNYAGSVGFRRPQFRVGATANIITFKLAAARTIGSDMDGLGQDDGADSGMPSIQGNFIVAPVLLTEKASKFSVSGVFGKETVDTEVVDATGATTETKIDDKDYDSWLALFSMALPITDMFSLNGVAWTGENVDNYYGGIAQGINLAEDKAIAAQGGWIQLLVKPVAPVTLGVAYGLDDPKDGDLNDGNRSKNERINVNAFYSLTKSLSVAIEYANIKTSYKETDSATDNRVQAAVQYNF